MKLGRLLIAWGTICAIGYAFGQWMYSSKLTATDAASFLKAGAFIFTGATACLAVVFRVLDTAPPKELDDGRQDFWIKTLNARYRMLWVRWALLLISTGAAALASSTLDGKFSFWSEPTAFRIGGASIFVGLVGIALSVYETIRIRRVSQDMTTLLKDRKKLQDLLTPSEDKSSEQGSKPVRA